MSKNVKILVGVVLVVAAVVGGVFYFKGGEIFMGRLFRSDRMHKTDNVKNFNERLLGKAEEVSNIFKKGEKAVRPAEAEEEITEASITQCDSLELLYSSEEDVYGPARYGSFTEFVAAVENGGLEDCLFHIQGEVSPHSSMLAGCNKEGLYAQNGTAVSCSKRVDDNFYRVTMYEEYVEVIDSMDSQDSDDFKVSEYTMYEPFSVYIQ